VPLQTHNRHYNHCRGADQKYVKSADHIFVDRIDIQCEIVPVPFEKISEMSQGESSATIRERVVRARKIQEKRFADYPQVHCNAQMESRLIRKFAQPDNDGLQLLRDAMQRLNLSARAYDRILKVARTIADLDNKQQVESSHLAEAISYRNLDRSDWAEQ